MRVDDILMSHGLGDKSIKRGSVVSILKLNPSPFPFSITTDIGVIQNNSNIAELNNGIDAVFNYASNVTVANKTSGLPVASVNLSGNPVLTYDSHLNVIYTAVQRKLQKRDSNLQLIKEVATIGGFNQESKLYIDKPSNSIFASSYDGLYKFDADTLAHISTFSVPGTTGTTHIVAEDGFIYVRFNNGMFRKYNIQSGSFVELPHCTSVNFSIVRDFIYYNYNNGFAKVSKDGLILFHKLYQSNTIVTSIMKDPLSNNFVAVIAMTTATPETLIRYINIKTGDLEIPQTSSKLKYTGINTFTVYNEVSKSFFFCPNDSVYSYISMFSIQAVIR